MRKQTMKSILLAFTFFIPLLTFDAKADNCSTNIDCLNDPYYGEGYRCCYCKDAGTCSGCGSTYFWTVGGGHFCLYAGSNCCRFPASEAKVKPKAKAKAKAKNKSKPRHNPKAKTHPVKPTSSRRES